MEKEKFSLSGTFQKLKEYIDTQITLLRLEALSKGSRILGSLILDLTKVVLILLVLFFFSLALGFFLGEQLGSYALGFLLTGVIFFVIFLVISLFKSQLQTFFMNITIRKVASKWNEEVEEQIVEEEGNNTKTEEK